MQEDHSLKTFILPYIIEDSATELGVTLEEEIAAVACLAFSRRRKVGIMGGKIEEIRAISKIYYPLICAPWGRGCFIADGLGFLGFTLPDIVIPDMLQLIETLRKNSAVLRNFIEIMDYDVGLLQKAIKSGSREYRVNNIIGERELLETISSLYDKLMLISSIEGERSRLIRSKLQMSHLENIVENLSRILDKLDVEISMLRYTLKVFEDEVNNHLKMLSKEGALVIREYRERESKLEAEISRATKLLNEKMLKETADIKRKYEKRIKVILREIERVERAILRNKVLLEESSKKRGGGKRKSMRIEDLTKRSKDLRRAIEEIEAERNHEIKNISEKYNALIESEREKIKLLKDSRDADINKINENVEKIKRSYSIIKESIMQIISVKERLIKMIEECSLPIKTNEAAIIGIPFYAIMYESYKGIRLDFHAPARNPSQTMMTKTNLESRIINFLTPIDESLGAISRILMENWSKDPYLNSEVKRIIEENNILLSRSFIEILRRGFERLRQSGWLTTQEENTLIDFYKNTVEKVGI